MAAPDKSDMGKLRKALENLTDKLVTRHYKSDMGNLRKALENLTEVNQKQIPAGKMFGTRLQMGLQGMGGVMRQLTQAFSRASDMQSKAIAIGTNLGRVTDQVGSELKAFRVTGVAMEGQLEFLSEGLKGSSAGMTKLIVQTKLTGQQTAGVAKMMAGLQSVLGMSLDETGSLGEKMIALSETYGVKTDVLVQAIESMRSEFMRFNALGMGETMAGIMADLGTLGPQFTDAISTSMKELTGDSVQSMAAMSRLGITQYRELFSQGEGTTSMFVEAILKSANQYESMIGSMGNVGDLFTQVGDRFTQGGILQRNPSENMIGSMGKVGDRFTQEGILQRAFDTQMGRSSIALRNALERAAKAQGMSIRDYVAKLEQTRIAEEKFRASIVAVWELFRGPVIRASTFLARMFGAVAEHVPGLITALGHLTVALIAWQTLSLGKKVWQAMKVPAFVTMMGGMKLEGGIGKRRFRDRFRDMVTPTSSTARGGRFRDMATGRFSGGVRSTFKQMRGAAGIAGKAKLAGPLLAKSFLRAIPGIGAGFLIWEAFNILGPVIKGIFGHTEKTAQATMKMAGGTNNLMAVQNQLLQDYIKSYTGGIDMTVEMLGTLGEVAEAANRGANAGELAAVEAQSSNRWTRGMRV